MAVVQCDKGHFYDNLKYPQCPHCQRADIDDDNVTVANKIKSNGFMKNLINIAADNSEKTVGIYKKSNFLPVTGWLVCIEGPEKGRDYRLAAGQNFIGRSHMMEICIADDAEISRERHCNIVFDPKQTQFSLVPGLAVTYLNSVKLTEPEVIKEYDKIKIGKSTFCFVPYCKKGVEWN